MPYKTFLNESIIFFRLDRLYFLFFIFRVDVNYGKDHCNLQN